MRHTNDECLICKAPLEYLREHEMTPNDMIDQLTGMERFIFQKLYAGKISKNLYRMYEFR